MTPRKDGFVLVCVLWVLVVLTIITVSFGRKAVLERRAAAYALDHDQALNMARGAVQRGMVELCNKAHKDVALNPAQRGSYTGLDQSWRIHPTLTEEGYLTIEEPGNGDTVTYIIRDESSRISVNRAPKEILDKIEGLGVRGAEQIVSLRGISGDPKPREPFLILEQVLELDGVDKDAWTGSEDKPGLRGLLTCWGSGKINVNTASRQVLEHIPDMAPGVVDAILAYRSGSDGQPETNDDRAFSSVADLIEKTQLDASLLGPVAKFCTLDSQFFTITGLATQRQGKIRAVCEATVEIRNGVSRILQWREDPSGA
ncbi:MAG: hypothetical protein HZB26_21030 [Candidatus Hydrogenedentes bacterium]|nr:hypothetical protein [Candidatus Hydrogenedentota bacterium]